MLSQFCRDGYGPYFSPLCVARPTIQSPHSMLYQLDPIFDGSHALEIDNCHIECRLYIWRVDCHLLIYNRREKF